jgi:hypothetical protein
MYGILARSAQQLGLVQGPKNTAFEKKMLKKRCQKILHLLFTQNTSNPVPRI